MQGHTVINFSVTRDVIPSLLKKDMGKVIYCKMNGKWEGVPKADPS